MESITLDMTIADIFSNFPSHGQKLAQVMTQAGLHCVGCNAATWETLEAGMLSHGKTEPEIQDLLKKLNTVLEEKVDLTTISLTESAAEKFKQFAKEDQKENWGLRFGNQVGGCGGFEYLLDFEEKPQEKDHVFESFGVKIFVNQNVLPQLMGSQIDYIDGMYGSGFKITNPNAKSSCGCGKSQSY